MPFLSSTFGPKVRSACLAVVFLAVCLPACLFAAEGTRDVPVKVSFVTGWNLFSLPAVPPDLDLDAFFQGKNLSVIWSFAGDHYEAASVIEPGFGYWVYMLEPATVIYSIDPLGAAKRSSRVFQAGWNLAGAVSPVPDSGFNGIPWEFRNGAYVRARKLVPGRGYFIFSPVATTPDLGSLDADGDADEIPDYWESLWGLDTTLDDAAGDMDGDGLKNLAEYQERTAPDDGDSDDDGFKDGEEVHLRRTSPLNAHDPSPLLRVVKANAFPTRLAKGPDGKIYVSDAKAGSVFIYTPAFFLADELKNLDSPLGVAVDGDGRIYVGSNGRDRVEIYDAVGRSVGVLGEGKIKMPNDLAIDRDGRLYVADSETRTIWVFEADGTPAGAIGSPGEGDGQFGFPVAVTVAYRDVDGNETPELYVGDQGRYLVHVFTLEGNYLRSFGGMVSGSGFRSRGRFGLFGPKWKGRFAKLQGLDVDAAGRLHAIDCYMGKVQILNPESGQYIDSYGTSGTGPGQLNVPLDVLITKPGEIVIANAENGRLEVLTNR